MLNSHMVICVAKCYSNRSDEDGSLGLKYPLGEDTKAAKEMARLADKVSFCVVGTMLPFLGSLRDAV